jgi:hypothetical protein
MDVWTKEGGVEFKASNVGRNNTTGRRCNTVVPYVLQVLFTASRLVRVLHYSGIMLLLEYGTTVESSYRTPSNLVLRINRIWWLCCHLVCCLTPSGVMISHDWRTD